MAEKQNTSPKSPAKKAALRFLRAALVIAPLAWIYARTDAAALMGSLSAISPWLLFAIAALIFNNMALQGVKWWVLLRRFVPELRLGRAVSVHIESAFYSIVLPSAAQDLVKSAMLSRTHSPPAVWASTWLARLMGLFSLLIFSVAGLFYMESGILPDGFRTSLIMAAAVIAVLGALSFSKRLTRPARAMIAKFTPPKIMGGIERLRDGIYAFRRERGTLAAAFLVSLAVQFLIILGASLSVYAVSGRFYLAECLVFVPLVEIMVVSLPLTPGGVGVREALMALLFTRLGFGGEQIAAYATISVLGSMVRIFGGAPVVFRMIFRRKP